MISVIVPLHPAQDRRELLEAKLRALEGQGELEVLLVSDTPHPYAFLEEYRPPYPLRTLHDPQAGSAGRKRNRGAAAARGEYLIFSDDDVVPEAGWLEAFRQAFAREQAVYLGGFRFKEGQAWKPALRFGRVGFNNVNGVALGMARSLFERVGGFAEWLEGYGGEDLEFGYRVAKAGIPLRYLPQAQARHLGPTPTRDLAKARQAGAQAARIARYHKDPRLALELGVHPAQLVLKMAVLPWAKNLPGLGGDGALAYTWGAWEVRYE
jgi:cellulose synthase/poly-beta-1,6-N-acetylglucosamine synthase-like glycosyltransferase